LDDAIQAVVLDHGLPGMDGIETLERLRARYPDLPVIMLTGLNDAETAVKALRTGAADYLTKPFELKRLFDLLRQVCRETSSRPQAAVRPVSSSGTREKPKSRGIRSSSPKLKELLRQMEKAAALDSTILLTG